MIIQKVTLQDLILFYFKLLSRLKNIILKLEVHFCNGNGICRYTSLLTRYVSVTVYFFQVKIQVTA